MLKTSLQTITWGDPQHDRFDHIFGQANKGGFDGLEIGFRRLREIDINQVQDLLAKHGLIINASHIGGSLGDLGQAENERADFDAALDCLTVLGVPYLLYSGLNEADDNKLDASIQQLNLFAERSAERDITLLFHNHDWEFLNNRRIWDRLFEARSKHLGYAPDLGWAAKSGQDLHSLLNDLGSAIKILHFKDFASQDAGQNTCHIGQGIINLAPAWDWLEDNRIAGIWLTAEQDNAVDADKACAVNGAYLRANLHKFGNKQC